MEIAWHSLGAGWQDGRMRDVAPRVASLGGFEAGDLGTRIAERPQATNKTHRHTTQGRTSAYLPRSPSVRGTYSVY